MSRWESLWRWVAVFMGYLRPVVLVRCAWCEPKRIIGEKDCDWSQAGLITDSICRACLRVHFPEARPVFPADGSRPGLQCRRMEVRS
jgi:hypothetical protein